MKIRVGARSSPLSLTQVKEVLEELREYFLDVSFEITAIDSKGDKDKKTSLRTLDKTDFFTKEIDEMVLNSAVDVGIHSAKDLPDPLPPGLSLIALTKGVDSRDSLVFREGESMRENMVVATSSHRREEMVRSICKSAKFIDIRGTIQERLKILEEGGADAIVVAEAALIRLKLIHVNRLFLPGETTPLQGQLAIIGREEDQILRKVFQKICTSSS